jgi:hypothetical protein
MREYPQVNAGKVRDKLGGKWGCCKAALLIDKEPLINQGLFVYGK